MRLSSLWEFAVLCAFSGGLLWCAVALGVVTRWRRRQEQREFPEGALPTPMQRFHDALLILLVAAVPQCLLLSLPAVYPHGPESVPEELGVPAIVSLAALVVLWAWAGWCLVRASRWATRSWLTRATVGALFTPVAAILLAVFAYIFRGTR